ncbi:WD repeat-containing protein 53-like [Anneissia japonica]|uniref:WD repeat-containing protein 53-like n=1 Tax=Anneissia japonica TaxID=1529436 RepID=UPI001425B03D|nr:WD repeat-containing protein 53-like [Anneissia japonica]XP_033117941.1 WD repeat-containing protein 53-like [Anneissia japonica]
MATTAVAKWADGHTDSIISVAHNNSTLASGAEDHHICLWSDEGKVHSKLNLQDDVTGICFQTSNPNILYAASGNKLNLLDIRDFNHVQSCKEFNSEEINQVDINQKETFIVTCDDSGAVKVVDMREMRLFKTLQRHKNICTSVKFHPTKGCELISAGTDCIVNSWDFIKGRNLGSLDMHECQSTEDDSIPAEMYMVNPPLVYSIDVTHDGSSVICGLENGKVQVLELVGRGKFEPLCDLSGHRRGVSKVEIFQARSKEFIISGGNDGRVILWNGSEQKYNPHTNHKRKSKREGTGGTSSKPMKDSTAGASSPSYTAVSQIEHGNKINSLMAVVENKIIIYVVDQTENISLYDLSKSIGL